MAAILRGLIMGLIAGPDMAWMMSMPASTKGLEQRQAKFSAGNGPDHDKGAFGPDKSFRHTAILFGTLA